MEICKSLVIIDVDATEDTIHGNQEQRYFKRVRGNLRILGKLLLPVFSRKRIIPALLVALRGLFAFFPFL